MPDERLYCKVGGRWWTRLPKRGRKPIACPNHRGAEVEYEVIPEQFDPTPVPTTQKPAESRTEAPATPEMPATPDGKRGKPHMTLDEIQERFSPIDPETWIKLVDIDKLLATPRGQRDHNYTRNTQKHILGGLARRRGQTFDAPDERE